MSTSTVYFVDLLTNDFDTPPTAAETKPKDRSGGKYFKYRQKTIDITDLTSISK